MPRILFNRDFDWSPNVNATIAYQAGKEYPVTQACAEKAIADGAGDLVGQDEAPGSARRRGR